jgi:hypothetical protein
MSEICAPIQTRISINSYLVCYRIENNLEFVTLQPRAGGIPQLEGPKGSVQDQKPKNNLPQTHEEKMRAHTVRREDAVLLLGMTLKYSDYVYRI